METDVSAQAFDRRQRCVYGRPRSQEMRVSAINDKIPQTVFTDWLTHQRGKFWCFKGIIRKSAWFLNGSSTLHSDLKGGGGLPENGCNTFELRQNSYYRHQWRNDSAVPFILLTLPFVLHLYLPPSISLPSSPPSIPSLITASRFRFRNLTLGLLGLSSPEDI